MPLPNLWSQGRETTDILQTGLGIPIFRLTGKDDAMTVIETATGTMIEEIGIGAIGLPLPEDETRLTGIVDHLTEAQDGMSPSIWCLVTCSMFSHRYPSPRRGL